MFESSTLFQVVNTPHYSTAEAAEQAFYRAFENADLDAMMNVWSDRDEIECIHPMGERLRGLAAIRNSWEQIFFNPPAIKFEIEKRQVAEQGPIAVHIVSERMVIVGSEQEASYVLATNVFKKDEHGWKMIIHHASPAPRHRPRKNSPILH